MTDDDRTAGRPRVSSADRYDELVAELDALVGRLTDLEATAAAFDYAHDVDELLALDLTPDGRQGPA